ncbi:unnamed protein product [Symbiodinium necroappetens]|uniref:Uncharacterized protein n=1 Tax=Symbiodinium necroappetens TaxID=1628268 RepID=A0A813BEI2_9DINO|nr:unnamed protein product [Symbiodinium necroappetens]
MPVKKRTHLAGAGLALLCVPATTSWSFIYLLTAPDWKEKVLRLRGLVPPPRPSQEQWMASWSKVAILRAKCSRNWKKSPKLRDETLRNFSADILTDFVALIPPLGTTAGLFRWFLEVLELWCSDALGGDIVLELVGSQVRGTSCLDGYGDLDFQVSRRPGTARAYEPFTETDKLRVAQKLEQQPFITNLTIGSIAIKFSLDAVVGVMNVDLVLWRERPEEFPALRGGSNFYSNSKKINACLDEFPAAKNALIAIKRYCKYDRPKGLLLDAIAWRLWPNVKDRMDRDTLLRVPEDYTWQVQATDDEQLLHQLARFQGTDEELEEQLARFTTVVSFRFFQIMLDELRNWKSSRYFGRELQQDLSNLSDKQRDKYTSGFENIARITNTELQFRLLLGAAESRLATTSSQSHRSTLPAAAEEALKHYFSAVLDQDD